MADCHLSYISNVHFFFKMIRDYKSYYDSFGELRLKSFAYAYEQATKHRKAPKFIPTFDMSYEL